MVILILFAFLLPLSIRICYLNHLVANRMGPSMCPNPCGTKSQARILWYRTRFRSNYVYRFESWVSVLRSLSEGKQDVGFNKGTFVVKTPEVMLNLYKTLVHPHLEYCISAWSPHYQKDKKLLEKVQHRFTRMITSLKWLQYEARLQELGLWTLEERRNRADLIEVFKMAHGFSAIPLTDVSDWYNRKNPGTFIEAD